MNVPINHYTEILKGSMTFLIGVEVSNGLKVAGTVRIDSVEFGWD